MPPWRGHAFLHADLIAAGEDVVWADEEEDPTLDPYRALRAKYCRDASR